MLRYILLIKAPSCINLVSKIRYFCLKYGETVTAPSSVCVLEAVVEGYLQRFYALRVITD